MLPRPKNSSDTSGTTQTYTTRRGRRKLTGMVPASLRLVALAGIVAFLVGAAPLAQTPEPAQDDSIDIEMDIEVLRTHANAGDAEAQFFLGVKYSFNVADVQDYAEAMKWFRRAAEQGHASAILQIGVAYENGRGVPQDYAEAMRLYRRAAEQGQASAMWSLGEMYTNGRGGPQDYAEAYLWHNLAVTYLAHERLGSEYSANYRESWIKERDQAAEKLTPEQIADAQRRAREWFEAHPPE